MRNPGSTEVTLVSPVLRALAVGAVALMAITGTAAANASPTSPLPGKQDAARAPSNAWPSAVELARLADDFPFGEEAIPAYLPGQYQITRDREGVNLDGMVRGTVAKIHASFVYRSDRRLIKALVALNFKSLSSETGAGGCITLQGIARTLSPSWKLQTRTLPYREIYVRYRGGWETVIEASPSHPRDACLDSFVVYSTQ